MRGRRGVAAAAVAAVSALALTGGAPGAATVRKGWFAGTLSVTVDASTSSANATAHFHASETYAVRSVKVLGSANTLLVRTLMTGTGKISFDYRFHSTDDTGFTVDTAISGAGKVRLVEEPRNDGDLRAAAVTEYYKGFRGYKKLYLLLDFDEPSIGRGNWGRSLLPATAKSSWSMPCSADFTSTGSYDNGAWTQTDCNRKTTQGSSEAISVIPWLAFDKINWCRDNSGGNSGLQIEYCANPSSRGASWDATYHLKPDADYVFSPGSTVEFREKSGGAWHRSSHLIQTFPGKWNAVTIHTRMKLRRV